MKLNILVIVLGSVLELQDYLKEFDLSFEKLVTYKKGGDLPNFVLEDDSEYGIEATGEDLDSEVLEDFKIKSVKDYELLLEGLLKNNPVRVPSESDVFGLYSNSFIKLKSKDFPEDTKLEIRYNYLFKGEDLPDDVDMLYIFDNADPGLKTYEQVEYLAMKYDAPVEIHTYHDKEEYKLSLKMALGEKADFEVYSFNF